MERDSPLSAISFYSVSLLKSISSPIGASLKASARFTNLSIVQPSGKYNNICRKSGQSIIQAIIAGERNPTVLAQLVQPNVKKSKEEIADSLEGSWDGRITIFIRRSFFSLAKHPKTHLQNRCKN